MMAELDQRQSFMKTLIDIEDSILKNREFSGWKEARTFKENNIPKSYQDHFKWNRSTRMMERNVRNIKAKISRFGYFVLSTNRNELDKGSVLAKYRDKDSVQKVFDVLKNEMDGGRLRAYSQCNADA